MKWVGFLLFFLVKFADAQVKDLHYYIQAGLKSSPLLKDYQFQIESNQVDSLRLRASYGPRISASAAGYYAPVVKGWGYDGAVTDYHTFNAMIGVSQTLIGKNNLNNQYHSLELQNLGLFNQGKLTEQELQRNITQQYITTYGDLLQINFNKKLLTLLQGEEKILKSLTEQGVYKQTDFLSFLVNIQQQELVLKQLRIQYQNDFGALNYITGINDTSFTELEKPELEIASLPDFHQTVFYHRFIIDSLQIANRDRQVEFNYKPVVNLFANGGYFSSFETTPWKNFGLSGGISLTLPIYDGGQRKLFHTKYAIAEESRQNYRDFYLKQYDQQLAQLKQQLDLANQLIVQTTKQINYAEGLIEAQRKQLASGDVKIADYIIAIGNLLNAENVNTRNAINKMQIINQINYWNRKQ